MQQLISMVDFFRQYKIYAEERYAFVRVLGMKQSVELAQIYTDVQLYDHLRSQLTLNSAELKSAMKFRVGHKAERRAASDVVSKNKRTILLGSPGSGKSTFVRSLALQAARRKRCPKMLPLIVSAPRAARDGKSIYQAAKSICEDIMPEFGSLFDNALRSGNFQLIVDGLDEVRAEQRIAIIDEIEYICSTYISLNMIVTCRTSAYEFWFSRFRHFEISAFTQDQVFSFVNRWFRDDIEKSTELKNVIKGNESIYEICTNPLFATIVCIASEDGVEIGSNRAEIYKEAVDTLVKKWDGSRNIYRENAYKLLSPKRRVELLSLIALKTFVNDDIVFSVRSAAKIIEDFILSAPECMNSDGILDPEGVILAISSQHGLLEQRSRNGWSFSHLTLQEYFTAYFVSSSSHRVRSEMVARYFGNADWKEVMSLVAALLTNADDFVCDFMKAVATLNFGEGFRRRVETEVRNSVRYIQSKRDFSESIFSDKNSEYDNKLFGGGLPFLKVIDGGIDNIGIKTLRDIQRWKLKIMASLLHQPYGLEFESHGIASVRTVMAEFIELDSANKGSLQTANGYITNIFRDVFRALKRDLDDIWTPGVIFRITESVEQQLEQIKLIDEKVTEKLYSLDFETHLHSALYMLVENDDLKEDFDIKISNIAVGVRVSLKKYYESLMYRNISRLDKNKEKIKAYISAEILFDMLNSSAIISPPVRSSALAVLSNFVTELPDPPDSGGGVGTANLSSGFFGAQNG